MIAEKIWGNNNFLYEEQFIDLLRIKKDLYSKNINGIFDEFNCLNHFVINKERLAERDILNQRSYIDFRLRVVDHLVADHGDRMGYANSVEVRYPFLDRELAEFLTKVPSFFKLNDFSEKLILKQLAKQYVPKKIIEREKFSFVAPGSSSILKTNNQYINELLSYDRIKDQGVFDPKYVELLKKKYSAENFQLNVPFEKDILIIVITFQILLEKFDIRI